VFSKSFAVIVLRITMTYATNNVLDATKRKVEITILGGNICALHN
jgi:hypothetical protein